MAKGLSILIVLIGILLLVLFGPRLFSHAGLISSAHAAAATPVNPTPIMSATQEEDQAAEQAALAGAQAFYTVDYRQGMQAWLDRLCSVSTATGCDIYQNMIAPKLWDGFEQAKTVTTAQASAEAKVADQIAASRDNAPMQLWRLQVHLSAPWPQQKVPRLDFPALALVIKENGAWKFERFLTEEEAQVLK
jgi:hypothetical protein